MSEKLLHTKQEAMKIIGIGERAFDSLRIAGVRVGRRLMYRLKDIEEALDKNKEQAACRSIKGRGRRTTTTTSRLKVLDFEEALKRTATSLPAV